MRTYLLMLALAMPGCGDDDGPAGADGAPGPDGTPGGPDGTPPSLDGGLPTDPNQFFPEGSPWYEDISAAPLDPESAAITQWLTDNGGWGLGRMQIDFSIEVLEADATTPYLSFMPTGDFYDPDCDNVPFPVPVGGVLEGEDGYECLSDGDCHLIVVDRAMGTLSEMWRANIVGGTFYGGCAAIWDMTRVYPPSGRGEQCTSADAAGYPIAPLLFTADEVAAGEIAHAIRFILPNPRIRQNAYVHPATHGAGSGPDEAVPYGTRWRLKADFDMTRLPNEAARTVARAMQTYGMLLADGGSVALTARSDRYSTAKWVDLMEPRALEGIEPTDFEIVDGGPRIPLTFDCVRNP